MSHLQKITFVVMREMGAHDVLIYCRDHRCSHHVETTADGWAMMSGCTAKSRAGCSRLANRDGNAFAGC